MAEDKEIKNNPIVLLDCKNIHVIQKHDRVYVLNVQSVNYKEYVKRIEEDTLIKVDSFRNAVINID